MLKPVEKIKQEHEQIERELIELETIMEDEAINYSNLIHTLRILTSLWEKHERKENIIFPVLEKRNSFKIPVGKALNEHEEFKIHREAIIKAIEKGEEETKNKLEKEGKELIRKLRDHINKEDEILYTLSKQESLDADEIKYITKKLRDI